MKYGKKGGAGATRSTGCYSGKAGGIPAKIGGGTTYPARKASKIVKGGYGRQLGKRGR